MVRQSNGRDDKKSAPATAVDSAGVAFRRPGARFRHPVHETAISRWPGNILLEWSETTSLMCRCDSMAPEIAGA